MIIEIICPNCNFLKKIPKEKIPVGVRWATCPSCKRRFEFAIREPAFDFEQEQKGAEPAGRPERGVSPWENRSELGVWNGIYQTFKAVLFSPENLFSNMTYQGGIKEPMAFGLLLGSIGTMLGFFWSFLIMSRSLLPIINSLLPQFQISRSFIIAIFMFIMVISPFLVAINIFITSGILHLLLLIFGAGKNKFEATFRVVSYSHATQVWSLVPFIGALIKWFWQLIVNIIGIREIHETSYLRAIIVVLLPLIMKLLMVVGVFIMLFIYGSYQINTLTGS